MAILYAPSRYVPVDGSGHVYPGAKLYFYQTGTTTLQDTYSDADLAVGHKNTNPVVADANGLFGPIYLGNNTVEYKAVLKTSADVTVWTTDPLSSTVAQSGLTPYAADTGTATAYAIAPTPAVTSVSVGQGYRFLAGHTNTTSTPTLTVGSATSGVITWPNGAAISPGDIKALSMVEVIVATATPTFHLQTYMGRWRIFGTATPSGVATVDFTGIPSTVQHAMLRFQLVPVSNAVNCVLQVYAAGVLDTGANYQYAEQAVNTGNTTGTAGTTGNTTIPLNRAGSAVSNNNGYGIAGTLDLIGLNSGCALGCVFSTVYFDSGGTIYIANQGGGHHAVVTATTGLRLGFSSGNILGGFVTCYVSD